MPEMPADVQRVVSKVNELVASRLNRKASRNAVPEENSAKAVEEIAPENIEQKDSVMSTPVESARSSDERPSESTLTVAEAVRNAVEARRKQEERGSEERSRSARVCPAGPRQQSQSSIQVQVQEILRQSSAETIRIGLGSDIEMSEETPVPSPRQEKPGPEATGLGQHAKRWREHRRSLGVTWATNDG